jgi:hypothetical protein
MSGWTYPLSSGLRPTEAALKIAVGLRVGELVPKWHMTAAERAFISIPGVVSRITGFEAGLRLPSVKEGFRRVHPGDRVRFPTNNVEKCGNFISQADTHSEAVWAAEEACRTTLVVLDPGDAETAAFLFGREVSWIPPAYRIEDPAIEARVKRLPLFLDESNGSGNRLSIMPLPGIETLDALVDWHGRSLKRSLELVQIETGVPINSDGGIVLGRVFWKALLRGGAQGGIWVIDTVIREIAERNHVDRLVTAWSVS